MSEPQGSFLEPSAPIDDAASPEGRAWGLVAGFFADFPGFGEVRAVPAPGVPEPFRRLLDHRSHMTVTMESHVGGPVALRVLRETRGGVGHPDVYSREILLLRPSGEPVQYGIVRINLAAVPNDARRRIEEGSAPLGRVLIEAGTLREVHDVALVKIEPGPELARRVGARLPRLLYGRVATITIAPPAGSTEFSASSQSRPASSAAIELLEIPIP